MSSENSLLHSATLYRERCLEGKTQLGEKKPDWYAGKRIELHKVTNVRVDPTLHISVKDWALKHDMGLQVSLSLRAILGMKYYYYDQQFKRKAPHLLHELNEHIRRLQKGHCFGSFLSGGRF